MKICLYCYIFFLNELQTSRETNVNTEKNVLSFYMINRENKVSYVRERQE